MRLDKLVLIGYLSANLLAPATGYSNSMEDPRPVAEESETTQNRFEKGERKSRHEGPDDEYCGGPDDNCGPNDGESLSDEDGYLLQPPVPVHNPVFIKKKNDKLSEPTQVIDLTKPEESPVTPESEEYQPQAHTEDDENKNTDDSYKPSHILLEQLEAGTNKSTYFDQGKLHFKWTATTCVSSTGNDNEDLASAIIEVEKSFKEKFGIDVRYDVNKNHAYDDGKGITDLTFKLGESGDQYCAEIDARINPLLRK